MHELYGSKCQAKQLDDYVNRAIPNHGFEIRNAMEKNFSFMVNDADTLLKTCKKAGEVIDDCLVVSGWKEG